MPEYWTGKNKTIIRDADCLFWKQNNKNPAKLALLLPGIGAIELYLLFYEKIFDKNTIIYWTEYNSTARRNIEINIENICSLYDIDRDNFRLCHGSDKKGNKSYKLEYTTFDFGAKFDYVSLDLMGSVYPMLLKWFTETLSPRLSKKTILFLTTMNLHRNDRDFYESCDNLFKRNTYLDNIVGGKRADELPMLLLMSLHSRPATDVEQTFYADNYNSPMIHHRFKFNARKFKDFPIDVNEEIIDLIYKD